MENNIEINITHGQLENFSVYKSEDGKFNLSATIGLYTETKKKIASYSVDTRNYYGTQKIDLPINTIPAILKIAEEIEVAVIKNCREGQLALPDKNNE